MRTYRFVVEVERDELKTNNPTVSSLQSLIEKHWFFSPSVRVTELTDQQEPQQPIPEASAVLSLENELDAMARIIAHQNFQNIAFIGKVDDATAKAVQLRIARAGGGK